MVTTYNVNAQFRDLDRDDIFQFVKGSEDKYRVVRIIQENYSDSGRKCVYVKELNSHYEGQLTRHPEYPVFIF